MDYRKKYYYEWKSQGRCVKCGRPPVPGRVMCSTCKQAHKEVFQRRREQLKSAGICLRCKTIKSIPGTTNCPSCRDKERGRKSVTRRTIKDEVFAAYGGYKCKCCGEIDPLFLTIDHTNGGGEKHRRDITGSQHSGGGAHTYKWLKNHGFPPGYDILCFNCNCGKARNHGVCPHKGVRI